MCELPRLTVAVLGGWPLSLYKTVIYSLRYDVARQRRTIRCALAWRLLATPVSRTLLCVCLLLPLRIADSAFAGVYITEFMASNSTTLADEDGIFADWIEIYNSGPGSQNMLGWHLTDDSASKTKWTFPAVVLPANAYLVVFASEKNRAVAGSELHTNFKLNAAGEYLGLVMPNGVTVAQEYAPMFPPQTTDISYGLTVDLEGERCFLDPTPGAVNDETPACASVAPVKFSKTRGFYETPFNLTLSTMTPGATIRFTRDGSEPTTNHGTVYSGPISVSTTTVVRALGYKAGVRPVPPSDAQTYIFIDDVLEQPATVPGYPNAVYSVGAGKSAPHDHQMDPSIVNAPAYSDSIESGLLAIPTMSLAVNRGDMFGDDGFYDGSDVEAAASVEVIYPNDPTKSEQANCAVEGHSTVRLKRSLRLAFKGAYGPSSFRTELLETGPGSGDSAKKTVERLVLRGGNNRSWARAWNPDRTAYTEDEFYRSSQIAMSGVGSHGTFVHLYINGLYWGLYNAVEQPEEHFQAIYLGGGSSGWFSTNHSGAEAGDDTRWEYLRGPLVDKNLATSGNYAEFQQYLDVAHFSDYLILAWYTALTDWPDNNWYAGNRNDVPGPVRHFAWDGEWSWDRSTNETVNGAWVHPAFRASSSSQLDMARLWHAARANTEFMVAFADRVHKHTSDSGALTDEASHARWATLNAFIYDAVIAESARWGDSLKTLGEPTRTRDVDWQFEVDAIDSLIAGNATQLIAALRAQGYYPSIDAPTVSIQNGKATITKSSSGQIYYTTDESDPRAVGGAIAASAKVYSGTVTVAAGATVRSRVKNGSQWSALDELTSSAPPLCVTNADCADGNLCTTDTCSGTGCLHANNSSPCNDGLFCTANDLCGAGNCSGSGDPCGGGVPFCNETSNACDECQSAGQCDDGLYCNGQESCDLGACAADGVSPCALDQFCIESTDECLDCVSDADCSDGVYCNGAETCEMGSCVAGGGSPCPEPLNCDLELDACLGCSSNDDCDDSNACTSGHVCAAGVCSTPSPVACDDGLYCNGVETCDPMLGCLSGVAPIDCSGLTTDCERGVCDEDSRACLSDPLNEGGACDDDLECTTGDVCASGACVGASLCDEECEACGNDGGCVSRCGHPVSDPRGGIVASDALFLLQAGVGLQTCLACICDLNGSGATTASDALSALRAGVGIETPLSCPSSAVLLTSTTTTLLFLQP